MDLDEDTKSAVNTDLDKGSIGRPTNFKKSLLSFHSNDSTENEATDSSSLPYNEFNDSNVTGLDIFSHDSTHVHRVIEAERHTDAARKRAVSILQKLSMEVVEHDKEAASILQQLSIDVAEQGNQKETHIFKNVHEYNDNVGHEDCRDDTKSIKNSGEANFDNIRRHVDIDESSNPSVNKGNTHNKVFEKLETPSENDIEHLKRCILPLSPNARHKKRISGQFEFKRINSVLTVVRSFDSDSKQSYGSSAAVSTPSKTAKSSRSWMLLRRRGSKQSNKGSGRSLNSFNDSNALTDDVWMQEIDNKESKHGKNVKKKEKKAGDLPPKPKRRYTSGSMGAVASDVDRGDVYREDVISVFSHLSDLSLESVGHKARSNSPMVVTDASLNRETRIPDVLLLKTQPKFSRMAKLKRKLSFNKGKASF